MTTAKGFEVDYVYIASFPHSLPRAPRFSILSYPPNPPNHRRPGGQEALIFFEPMASWKGIGFDYRIFPNEIRAVIGVSQNVS